MKSVLVALLVLGCTTSEEAPPVTEVPGVAAVAAAPDDAWTWVPIEGTTCANGSTAGFAINPTHATDRVFVYFAGGGACWDAPSCFVAKNAVHVEDTLTAQVVLGEASGFTPNRADTTNPLTSATVVYVPYCTGDVHAGTNVATYGDKQVHHTGATNAQAFVDALAGAMPTRGTVWVAGSSAGGYGATMNFHRFTEAWGADVHLLQDSSPFVPVLANFAAWQAGWHIAYPPGCDGCETSFSRVIDAVALAHPASRIGLMTFTEDAVIKAFFGYTTLAAATETLLNDAYTYANTRAFVVAADRHVMLGEVGTLVGTGGVRLGDWIIQWVRGDAAWTTVRP